ncbi:MAG: hypothetical protein D3926_18975, partial [Desulfobacteraceae bacterium]
MQKEFNSKDQEKLFDILSNLTGHLQADSEKEEKSIQDLQLNLADTLSGINIETVKNNILFYENSDLFFPEKIKTPRLNKIEEISSRVSKETMEPNLRVFVRESPVRSSQLKGSVPAWARGAAVEKTFGPFTNKDSKKLWFDFYRIKRLTALYLEGENDPAILFNVSVKKRIIIKKLPPIIDPALNYKAIPDSVWINSKLLASNSPPGYYTGIKIKSGTISLSNAPKLIDNKLTVTGNTLVTVNLVLDQPEVTDADKTSPYGIDTRNAELNLPTSLNFHFSKSVSSINEIGGNTNWLVYGHKATFEWDNSKPPTFNSGLNRILIPFKCSEQHFAVNECKSP